VQGFFSQAFAAFFCDKWQDVAKTTRSLRSWQASRLLVGYSSSCYYVKEWLSMGF
jgi:hypothetical protein